MFTDKDLLYKAALKMANNKRQHTRPYGVTLSVYCILSQSEVVAGAKSGRSGSRQFAET